MPSCASFQLPSRSPKKKRRIPQKRLLELSRIHYGSSNAGSKLMVSPPPSNSAHTTSPSPQLQSVSAIQTQKPSCNKRESPSPQVPCSPPLAASMQAMSRKQKLSSQVTSSFRTKPRNWSPL